MPGFRSSNRSVPWIAIAFLSASFLVGCGSSGSPTVILEGKVTVDQAPANSGRILVTADNGSVVEGPIDRSGSYRVVGLSVGPVKITVEPQKDVPGAASAPGMPESATSKVDNPVPIPSKYAITSTSGLATTLKQGTNMFPIDLSSKE